MQRIELSKHDLVGPYHSLDEANLVRFLKNGPSNVRIYLSNSRDNNWGRKCALKAFPNLGRCQGVVVILLLL